MPAGLDPPYPRMTESVFSALAAMSYDSTTQSFSGQGGSRYFLFVEKPSGGSYNEAQWFYATDSEGGSNPKALIPALTGALIINGQYESSDQTVTYQSASYRIRLARDANGNQIAQVHVI